MKKAALILGIVILLLCAFSLCASAEIVDSGTCGSNVTYTLDENGLLTISGAGAMRYYSSSGPSPFYKNLNIKTVVIAEGVTSIGNSAFRGCTGLTSVTIPNSVTSIGDSAFAYCSGLTSITIPEGVTSIGDDAFWGCTGLLSVTIPNSVTSIGNNAFSRCAGLTSITVAADNPAYHSAGNCLIETGTKTLIAGCNTSVIPTDGSVTSIGNNAFSDCMGLTSITIPDSVTSIGNFAFYGCTGLTSVTIPEGVTSIGYEAFRLCTGLTSITIPEGVTSIGEDAFSECYNLCVLCYKGSAAQTYCEGKSIAYGLIDGSEEENTFSGSVGILKWSIDRLTCVLQLEGNGNMPPFSSSSAPWRQYKNYVHSVVIHPGLQKISDSAFSGCSAMFEITIPESVTSIGNSAFSGCRGLTNITIPGSITSIGNSAFWGCTGLTSVTIPESVTSIGYAAFSGCTGLLSVTIPESVTSIGEDAFRECTGLTSITIPDSVTSIGNYAFYNCTGLTSITIPESVTSIGDYAFEDCTGLTSITIPEGVTSIGSCAFSGCSSLTEMVLPFSVKTIGSSAFSGCTALQKLYIYNKTCSIASAAIPSTATICGFAGSAVQTFADDNGYLFEPISHTEHAWNAGEITAAATCVENGVIKYTCTICGATETEPIPATGNHTPGAAVRENEVAATCANAGGYDEVVYCTVCSAELSREAKVTETLAHTPVKVAGSAATCTAAGLTDGVKCAVCGEVLTAPAEIPALGHDFGAWTVTKAAACTEKGEEKRECSRCGAEEIRRTEALSHSLVSHAAKAPSCTETGWNAYQTCTRCDYTTFEKLPANGHDYVSHAAKSATCTEAGWGAYQTCSRCDYTSFAESPALGHAFGAWSVVQTPTCGVEGAMMRLCTVCGEVEQKDVPATGKHTPGEPVETMLTAATCTAEGTKGITVACTVCRKTLSETTEAIPALGHVEETIPAVAATCTEKGKTAGVKCGVCGEILTAPAEIPATGHTYKNVVTKATLTKDGKLTPTCTVCGATKTATVISKASKIMISKAKFVYNGKVQKPTLVVKDSKGSVIPAKYYTAKWSNVKSTAVGKYTVTVTFKGNYSGTKTLTYTIVPKAVTGVKNAASTTKSVKLSWAKATGAKYYDVFGSTDGKTFKKIATVSANTLNVTKVNGKALAAGKTYWFKVRALDATKKLIGAYSAALKTGTKTAAPKLTKLTSAKSKTATATWGQVTGAKSYVVYKSLDGKKWVKAGSTTGTSFTLTKLSGGKRIYVKVLVVNAYNANSAYSAVKYVTVKK